MSITEWVEANFVKAVLLLAGLAVVCAAIADAQRGERDEPPTAASATLASEPKEANVGYRGYPAHAIELELHDGTPCVVVSGTMGVAVSCGWRQR